jgi:4-amino-4-deoxy-L-arabinose transferase-like glycosyltransferase
LSNKFIPNITSKLSKLLRRWDLLAIFALAVFLRLALFAMSNNQATVNGVLDKCFDCRMYLNMAQSIAGRSVDSELGFFFFGPGYAAFLALMNIVAHGKPGVLILINILISAASCLLIYKLAMKLTRTYAIAIVAAILAAVSYTSIVLSVMVMSDVFYFFLILVFLLIYLEALDSQRTSLFVLAGLIGGYSVLVRSVGQFWPIPMIIIAVAWLWKRGPAVKEKRPFPWKTVGKVALSIGLVMAITLSWMIRNYHVHGVFAPAFTSANGPANVAAVTVERLTGTPSNEVLGNWYTDYQRDTGDSDVTLGELYHIYSSRARQTFDTLGWQMIKTYATLDWENLNEINYMHRILLPKYDNVTIPLEGWIMRHRLNYINLVLSMAAFVILLATGRARIAVVLGSIYFYYAALIGAYRWQYSRHFFPGQIAWAILVSITLVFIGNYVIRSVRRIRARVHSHKDSPTM